MKVIIAYIFAFMQFSVISLGRNVKGYSNRPAWNRNGLRNLFGTNLNKAKQERPSEVIEAYFRAWNCRDMDVAISYFASDCIYEDTLYPETFRGKEQLRLHLKRVAKALPASFQFVVDEMSASSDLLCPGGDPVSVGVRWHVESEGKPLPFTRGSSMYAVDAKGLITRGFDVPEPVLKSGNASLKLLETASGLIRVPARAAVWAAWVFYIWFLFFSDVAPGPNVLALDPGTWQEVKDLSLNFWFVLPTFDPASAAVLHPCLEGVFNLLIAWTTLFWGFVTDGRTSSGRASFLPSLTAMQALTNAVYLPYLATRVPEPEILDTPLTQAKLSSIERLGESRVLPVGMLVVGAISTWWALFARADVFGDMATRTASFEAFLGHDRLGFSFVVDLLYFSVFQGWLVSDDCRRRGMKLTSPLAQSARYVPFLGLVAYLLFRVPLPSGTEKD